MQTSLLSRFRYIVPPAACDVILTCPTAPNTGQKRWSDRTRQRCPKLRSVDEVLQVSCCCRRVQKNAHTAVPCNPMHPPQLDRATTKLFNRRCYCRNFIHAGKHRCQTRPNPQLEGTTFNSSRLVNKARTWRTFIWWESKRSGWRSLCHMK